MPDAEYQARLSSLLLVNDSDSHGGCAKGAGRGYRDVSFTVELKGLPPLDVSRRGCTDGCLFGLFGATELPGSVVGRSTREGAFDATLVLTNKEAPNGCRANVRGIVDIFPVEPAAR
jgi:hypothetical protein